MTDILAIKRKLLVKYPFFGSVITNINYVETNKVQAAGTDGKTIYFNPEFVANLQAKEQIFLFAHEACHIAFNHILRSKDKEKEVWNIATDAVINAFLQKDGLPLIEGGVNISEAIDYNAEEMYEKLLKEQQAQKSMGQGQGSNSSNSKQKTSGSQGDAGHDTHEMWEKAIEENEKKEKSEQSNGNNTEEKSNKQDNKDKNNTSKQDSNKENKMKKNIKNATQMGEKDSFKQNKKERENLLEKVKKELVQKVISAGKTTSSENRIVNNIGKAKPIIDWRRLLKEAIKYDVDWSYKNATVENGVVTPHLEEMPMPETEIVLDTSGSVNEKLLRNFLRECKNIIKTSKVKVGCFDTKFYGFHEIRREKDIDTMRFQGGGGTDFDAAVNAFSRRVENKIIFTDGEADMPAKTIDAIWIVFGNKKINPKGGKVINITNEQLRKLYNDNELYR